MSITMNLHYLYCFCKRNNETTNYSISSSSHRLTVFGLLFLVILFSNKILHQYASVSSLMCVIFGFLCLFKFFKNHSPEDQSSPSTTTIMTVLKKNFLEKFNPWIDLSIKKKFVEKDIVVLSQCQFVFFFSQKCTILVQS